MALKLIKDPVHGNIVFSELEAAVLSSPLFNRLHYVEQNSMAYLVYPALRNSRFMHSLGVMHVSSALFRNALMNAEEHAARAFLDEMRSRIDAIIQDRPYRRSFSPDELKHLEDADWPLKIASVTSLLGEHLLKAYALGPGIADGSNERTTTYGLLLEALRLTALFHDLGHLPGSHLGEFAVDDFLLGLRDKVDVKQANELEAAIYRDFADELVEEKELDLHEKVGRRVRSFLVRSLEHGLCGDPQSAEVSGSETAVCRYHILLLWEILQGFAEGGPFASLYRITNGVLDADRMDYVLRDGQASGFIAASGDIDRIAKQFVLRSMPGCEHAEGFAFVPTLQSLADVQELLLDRFRLYRFVVNHHKVRRMDTFVQRSIEIMLRKEAARGSAPGAGAANGSNAVSAPASDQQNASEDLYGKRTYELRKQTDTTMDSPLDILAALRAEDQLFEYRFAQLTDDWLRGLLKREYNRLRYKRWKGEQLDLKESELLCLLEQVFTFAKGYRSAWKRDHEYRKVVRSSFERHETETRDFLQRHLDSASAEQYKKERFDPALAELGSRDHFRAGQRLVELLLDIKGPAHAAAYMEQEFRQAIGKNLFIAPTHHLSPGVDGLNLGDLKDPSVLLPFSEACKLREFLHNERFSGAMFFVYYSSEDSEAEIRDLLEDHISPCVLRLLQRYLEPQSG